jgi:hypothetical protein
MPQLDAKFAKRRKINENNHMPATGRHARSPKSWRPLEKNLRVLHRRGLVDPRVDDLDALLVVSQLLSPKLGDLARVRDALEKAIDAESGSRSDLLRVWFGLPAISPNAPDTRAMTSAQRHRAAWEYEGGGKAESTFRTHRASEYFEALAKRLLAAAEVTQLATPAAIQEPDARSADLLSHPASLPDVSVPTEDPPTTSSEVDGFGLLDRLGRRHLLVGFVVVAAIALVVVIATSTGAPASHHSTKAHTNATAYRPSIVDATSGRLLEGAAALPQPDRIGNVNHLEHEGAMVCIQHNSYPSEACKYQSTIRYVCSNVTSAQSNTCREILVPRLFHVEFGDVITFHLPLADATLLPVPFLEFYLQSIRYAHPTNKILARVTAIWPASTYGNYTTPHLIRSPVPLCPPHGGRCPQTPRPSTEDEGEETLALMTLEFTPGEEGRLSYLPGSAALLDSKGHILARPAGDMLDAWGITLADLRPKVPRVLAFEVEVDSP